MSGDLTPELVELEAWAAAGHGAELTNSTTRALLAGYREREALRAERDRLASIVEQAKGAGADLIDAYTEATAASLDARWAMKTWETLAAGKPFPLEDRRDATLARSVAARSALEVALAEREALTFDLLRAANVERCNASFGWHMEEWTPNDWATALAGEVGELCNELKKLRRGDDSTPEALASRHEAIRHEAADVACYLDLLCARMGIDLGAAVREKFNAVSVRRGSPVRL